MTSVRQALFAASLAVGLALLGAPRASADIIHNDDVIITFSLCVGNDCVNGESFGFDTIRLKENNLRINFADTSNSSSFPTNDWRIVINDTSNGGQSYFAVEDSNTGRQVFKVEAAAPSNSLYVDDAGRLGLGTSTPVVDVHVVNGNTPTLRLEQDGSSGFTPQTFDIAANEANFFIRDVTNGSQLPFKIKPGADHNALYIAANNNIGLLTDSPSEELHLRRTDNANTIARVENTNSGASAAGVLQTLSNASQASFQSHGSGRTVSRFGETLGSWNEMLAVSGNGLILGTFGATPLILGTNSLNRLEITASGDVVHFSAGTVHPDYVFEPSYQLESIEDHAAKMWTKKHLPSVGPGEYTADGRAKFKLGAGRAGMLEELEKAHIYIEQLDERLKMKDAELEAVTERLARLEALLSQ